jgi:Flp pilus assembly protein TadG
MRSTKQRSRGQAMVEVTLMVPWILFLFVGILDCGFYAYALIATQNAARVAALQASYSGGTGIDKNYACAAVLAEMSSLPNTGAETIALCNAATVGTLSQTTPVSVTISNPLRDYGGGDVSTQVTVTYLCVPLIPIPGLLSGQMTIARTAEIRVGS